MAGCQVAALESHAHTILVTGLVVAESAAGQGIVTGHGVGVLAVAVPSNGLVVGAIGSAELVRIAVVVVTVVVNDEHQVGGAVEEVRSGQDNVVPALAEVHAVAENLHSDARVEQVDVAGAAESRLGGGLQPHGDIELVGHGRRVHVVEADGVDTHRTANLFSLDDGLAQGVFEVVVDRSVVAATSAVASRPGVSNTFGRVVGATDETIDRNIVGSGTGTW